MKKEYINLIINNLKNDKKMTFLELCNFLENDLKVDIPDKSKFLSDLYKELILDNRFYLYPDKKWGLREDMSPSMLEKVNRNTYTTEEFSGYINSTGVLSDASLTESDFFHGKKKHGKHKVDITSRIKDNLSKLNNLDKREVIKELGLTEEIDWDSIEKVKNENN